MIKILFPRRRTQRRLLAGVAAFLLPAAATPQGHHVPESHATLKFKGVKYIFASEQVQKANFRQYKTEVRKQRRGEERKGNCREKKGTGASNVRTFAKHCVVRSICGDMWGSFPRNICLKMRVQILNVDWIQRRCLTKEWRLIFENYFETNKMPLQRMPEAYCWQISARPACSAKIWPFKTIL